MKIVWSRSAWTDIDRLTQFMAERDLNAADLVFDRLANAPDALLIFPRRGSRLSRYDDREIRELHVGKYVLRYELKGVEIRVLRFFHGREDRS